MLKKILDSTILLLIALIIIGVAFIDGFEVIRVSGHSMSPTYKEGQMALAIKSNENLAVGDVVMFQNDDWAKDTLVFKRILAVPGDVVIVNGNDLHINGVKIDTGKVPSSFKGFPYKKYELSEDEYFLVGDNRTNSLDSRARGPIQKSDILSKIIEP